MRNLSFPVVVTRFCATMLAAIASLAATSCGGKVVSETVAEPRAEKPKPPTSIPMWLGNPNRNFFGTGPIPKSLKVIWDFETGFSRGRLHSDAWGGAGWPGQAAIVGDRVYFGSADSYIYCLNRKDGTLVWKYKTNDSAKSSACVVGDLLVIGNLDHTVYCLNARDGTLVWKYQTGFETDSSPAIVGDRVFIGGEDHFYYCFDLKDGHIVFKTQLGGSVEGGTTLVEGKIYVDTEAGELFCLSAEDGSIIWKSRIGADSNSTPAVVNGHVYTAAEDGVVSCYQQATGELVWKYKAGGGLNQKTKEKNGFWASPIVSRDRVYIGSRWPGRLWRQEWLSLLAFSEQRRSDLGDQTR